MKYKGQIRSEFTSRYRGQSLNDVEGYDTRALEVINVINSGNVDGPSLRMIPGDGIEAGL